MRPALGSSAMPARSAAAITMILGGASLVGWFLGIQPLTSIIPGAVEMKANNAFCQCLCGAALFILSMHATPRRVVLARLPGIAVAAVAAATLVQYIFGWDLKIDQLLLEDRVGAFNVFRGRMSPASATALLAIASALILWPTRRLRHVALSGALLGAVVGCVSLLGFAWGAVEIIGDRWLPPVALNTAACFALMGAGIWSLPRPLPSGAMPPLEPLRAFELKILASLAAGLAVLLICGNVAYRNEAHWTRAVERAARTRDGAAVQETALTTMRATTLASWLVTMGATSGLFFALFQAIRKQLRARRDAEEALRASDRYNRNIFESSPDWLSVLTLQGHVQHMTPRALELLEADDFGAYRDTRWEALWSGEHLGAARAALAQARGGVDGRFQGPCPTRKGTPKWWDVIVKPVLGADGTAERLLAVARDISDVKRHEDELLETNRFLDSLIDNLPVTVVIKDAATLRIVRRNKAFERAFGFSGQQIAGRSVHELFDREDADFSVAKDREALATGRLVEILEQTIHSDRLGMRVFHTMKVPVNGRGGEPQYLMSIAMDITSRKLAEQAIQELNTAMQSKASQLEAINNELESFSYSVSHDLRAPLRAIDGFAQMIEEDYSHRLDAEGRRYLAVIRDNSKRMGTLIDDLLALSRLGRLPVTIHEIDCESLVREVVEEALHGHAAATPRIEIGPLPPARGDPVLLRQVWTNLICNAIKYSSKVERPHITVNGDQSPSENLYSIADNGVGFNMAYADKLFGVFQRLHRADEFTGTGVGLAIVQRVVSRHGGRVWAEGKPNAGAVFSFALPRETCNE